MPPVASLSASGRFYARLLPLELECPSCGRIIANRLITGTRVRRKRGSQTWRYLKDPAYNPVTSRVTCPFCRKSYALGIVAWEVSKGGGDRPSDISLRPSDQIPTDAQLREIRRIEAAAREEAGGYTRPEKTRWGTPLNLFVKPGCLCPANRDGRRKPGSWSPHCPIHGDPKQQANRSAGPESGNRQVEP